MSLRYYLSLALLLGGRLVAAQDFQQEYRQASGRQDTAATRQVLQRWLQARPTDPDAYVSRFNYLLRQADAVQMQPGTKAVPGALAVRDKKGKIVGNMMPGLRPDLVEAACATLRRGLQHAPDRADMWFGLAHTYATIGQADKQVQALTDALAGHPAGQPWRWRNGADLPEPEAKFWPESLEEYIRPYWLDGSPAALETGRQLTALIVRYYPASALGPFNNGFYYTQRDQFTQAYEAFQQADKLQPNDAMTLANLTKLATQFGRKAEAQQYLGQLQKLPDGRQAAAQLAAGVRRLK